MQGMLGGYQLLQKIFYKSSAGTTINSRVLAQQKKTCAAQFSKLHGIYHRTDGEPS